MRLAKSLFSLPSPDLISRKGITNVSANDFEVAKKLGYTIKLVAHAEQINGKIYASVAPRFVPLSNPLAHISDVYNGILVGANMLDKVLFYGKGAGKLPTASAVVADIMDIAEKMDTTNYPIISWSDATDADIASCNAYKCKFCIISNNDYVITEKISTDECTTLANAYPNSKIYPII